MKLNELNLFDVGNTIQLAGAIYASGDMIYFVPFPHELTEEQEGVLRQAAPRHLPAVVLEMATPEWEVFLRQTDFLEVEVLEQGEDGKLVKAIRRKSQYQIDQRISWRVYKRDNFQCRVCGAEGVPLTVDHLIPWEQGGPTCEENLVAACKRCNKVRGNMAWKDWLRHPYYKEASRNLIIAVAEANEALVHTIEQLHKVNHTRKR